MENQSPTQEKLSREKIAEQIKNNLNYIYIVLMIICNGLISVLRVEDGKVGLQYPTNTLGWTMWLVQIGVSTFIGVMILNSFRRQGIMNGQRKHNDIYQKYLKTINSHKTEQAPRSLKSYMKSEALKDSLGKALTFVILNTFVLSVTISADWNALMALISNIIFAVSFGIKTMLDAEYYVDTELVGWYQQEIFKIEEKEREENERRLEERNV